ncbi:MAG TPA: polysaccharide deacetylase family protein [Clostridia bacterium]|nr:polysaccharide deacetylase family protein [Clostridia bacterium]
MKRRTSLLKLFTFFLIPFLLLQGCSSPKLQGEGYKSTGSGQAAQNGGTELSEQTPGTDSGQAQGTNTTEGTLTQQSGSTGQEAAQNDGTGVSAPQGPATPSAIDLNSVKPNEAGRVMIVMFHNFVDEYKKGDKLYTTTFDAFRKLLDTLYTSGYRLIGLNDYLNGNIETPAGYMPIVFTFDDGTAGQFNLIEENGTLKANPDSAAGIMEEFNRIHPDFGLKGTFYVNLGDQTFSGAGTVDQRLKYLIDKGFEIGNHTYSHINLKKTETADKIQQEIGENQKKMYELVPDYTFTTFSLPYGAPSKDLKQFVIKGSFEGTDYENKALMEVGWDPNQSPYSTKFDPMSIHRVRSSGIEPQDADLAWWLKNLKRSNEFVSDGNPSTVTVPESYKSIVDQSKLGGRALITY